MHRLYRSRHERVIAGVCGGLAEYFRVDVTVIRLLWAVAVFAAGTGVIAYIVAVLIIPEEPYGYNGGYSSSGGPGSGPTGPTGTSGTGTDAGSGAAGPTGSSSPSGPARVNGSRWPHSTGNPSAVFGWILLGLGLVFLVRNFLPWIGWGWFWPLALVAFGLVILVNSLRGEHK
ncbi:MAG TPA: PspC domain-containing protein [Bacillota bacterium]|jgi:phage shock protein PspC (stress-responsive transcriptional regulator)